MAGESWVQLFPTAYRSLTTQPAEELPWEEHLNNIMQEFEEHLIWLQEIPAEVVTRFAVKSTKLSQLPKTPSVKAKAQKRTRRQVETIEENDEALLPNLQPQKLEFDEESQTGTEAPSRPKRNCRKKRSSNKVDEFKPVRTTRQSRKAAVQKTCDIPESSVILEKPLPLISEKQLTVNFAKQSPISPKQLTSTDLSNATSSKQAAKTVNIDPKKTASPVPLSRSNVNNGSPSVRERANAYETMLKTKQAQSISPLKTKKVLTPSSVNASPNFTAATISSQAKASPRISTSKDNTVRQSKTRRSRRSSQRLRRSSRNSSRRSSSSVGKKKAPSKPLRSRLRLNKKNSKSGDKEKENVAGKEHEESDKDSIETQNIEKSSVTQTVPELAETQEKVEDVKQIDIVPSASGINDETQVVVTEVFEISVDGKGAELKEHEVIKTKTTTVDSVGLNRCSSDQGFAEGDQDTQSDSSENLNGASNIKNQPPRVQGPSTRTRTKKVHDNSTIPADSVQSDAQKAEVQRESPEKCERPTRTRTRAVKAKEEDEKAAAEVDCGMSSRTRQRKAEIPATKAVDNSVRDVSVVKPVVTSDADEQPAAAPCRSTRSRMKKVEQSVADGKDEEVIAGSPAIKSPTAIRLKKKRMVEDRGNTPNPKRSRSCLEEPSHLESMPMSTSSPVQQHFDQKEANDNIRTPSIQCPQPYLFNSTQKRTKGFLNRTPGFGNNTKVLTFFGSAPTHRNNGTLTSFLKRNTPPPKLSVKEVHEQKKQRLHEKQTKEKEQLRRAAEAKRIKLEEQKRLREERLRKVAETREMKEKQTEEMKKKMKQKFEDNAVLKEKLLEERMKTENEKQKLRMRKQMEADARRRHEEEERKRKRLEQEEDARRQEELMQRKKGYEELERKKQIAEERKRYEERIAELEQKKNEELARWKKIEEEKAHERERAKLEREKLIAQERAERDRIEREKREERDRKLKEEMERLKAMEKMRLKKQEEEAKQFQANQAKLNEMQKLINQHNQKITSSGSLNMTQTLVKGSNLNTSFNSNSYQITPAAKKLYKPSDNPDDYGLNDKGSDESTDDETAPKKRIPEWASGSRLDTALIKQFTNPPNIENIFKTRFIEPLNLMEVFPMSKQRHNFNKRTSSAIWTTPPVKMRTKH